MVETIGSKEQQTSEEKAVLVGPLALHYVMAESGDDSWTLHDAAKTIITSFPLEQRGVAEALLEVANQGFTAREQGSAQ